MITKCKGLNSLILNQNNKFDEILIKFYFNNYLNFISLISFVSRIFKSEKKLTSNKNNTFYY
ncbi:hypothetical protein BpHYR1_023038 [Brachionus plicatilis]|uniref:Uncharacterized protein n=1 Tax=Brachionus plicatilis TaxID=10195 RepID=A0A3M7QMQ9_BRAPC|nr:hypothetical protein BpHYR1_023038 [Brachionus plicatilis]